MNKISSPSQPDALDTIEGRYGPMYLPKGKDIIADALREYGEWAQPELDILLSFISPGDVVVDAGACFGTHARAFSNKAGPEGQVISFEPFPQNFTILSRNIEAAPVANIRAIPKAVAGAGQTELRMQFVEDNAGASHQLGDTDTLATSVPATTLDALDLPRVDFLKLDLEGGELEALSGAQTLLGNSAPIVFAEVRNLDEAADLFRHMQAGDYLCFGLNVQAFHKDNFFGSTQDIFHGGRECGFLFIPKSKLNAHRETITRLNLAPVETLDDIVILLINQPQYIQVELPQEAAGRIMGLPALDIEHAPLRQMDVQSAQIETLEHRVQEMELALNHAQNLSQDLSKERIEITRKYFEMFELAYRLSRKVRQFPFSLYFRAKKKYRRPTRAVIKSWRELGPLLGSDAKYPAMPENLPVGSLTNSLAANKHPGGKRAELLGEITEDWGKPQFNFESGQTKDLDSTLGAKLRARLGVDQPLVLSISHDNYATANYGGTQLCVQIEQNEAQAAGRAYLNMHPVVQGNTILPADLIDKTLYRLVLNGEELGITDYADLTQAVTELKADNVAIDVVVHHLMGHAPEAIARIVNAGSKSPCHVWLHDYFSLCQSYNLLRNLVNYCAAPPANSAACNVCVFGGSRIVHLERMAAFFKAVDPAILAPSRAAAKIWKTQGHAHSRIDVVPHVTLDWHKKSTPAPVNADAPVRIAFVGAPELNKGWEPFLDLVDLRSLSQGYEFHYFGKFSIPAQIIPHKVTVDAQNRDAMSRAIRQADIDLVLHFAPWPETFSFTALEALSAGAYLVTNRNAGNVAALVEETGRGVILSSKDALLAWVGSAEFHELITRARRDRATQEAEPRFSKMALQTLN